MYPSSPSGTRRLSRSQQPQPPRNAPPSQDILGSQFMPGEPGGFVLPGRPGFGAMNGLSAAPLGFLLPGTPHPYGQDGGRDSSACPLMHPLSSGEPGGFIAPCQSYARPQSPSHGLQARPQSPEHKRVPQYSSFDTCSSANSSQLSVPRSTNNPRNVPSRQGSVCSRYSASSSHRSAASPTMVNAFAHPKHSQLRQPPYVQQQPYAQQQPPYAQPQYAHQPYVPQPYVHQQQRQQPPGPAYTWEDVRYGR
ncbi:hypothetical protein IWW54_001515 [Coemansia sp. RSA 2705]|nr:hypothetical protein IWW54_001515 [Coemansia sp. RSA 2705]